MNALAYKVIFSKRLGTLVAVGEHTSSCGKSACGQASRAVITRFAEGFVGALRFTFTSVALACLSIGATSAQSALPTISSTALPQGSSVNSGSVAVSTSGTQMALLQTTDKASLNWQSFNIGSNASVNIVQPSASAVMINRVVGNDPSQILGQLSANGQVILLNPNGIAFGKDGSVTASSFTASTFALSEQDFVASVYKYQRNGSTAQVVNQGTIQTQAGGFVALVGASVSNEGKITAPQGDVVLAAAESVTLPAATPTQTTTPANVSVRMSKRVRLEVTPAAINTAVNNAQSGVIMTEGGQVLMQAASLSDAVASVTHSGRIDTTAPQAGAVTLLADGGQIKVSGSITANSTSANNKGADIIIGRDADTGVLANSADVAGATLHSERGFIETSGEYLVSEGVKVKAAQWLLDPNNIEINATNVAVTAGNTVVLAADIANALTAGTSVTISTGIGVGSTSSATGVAQATAGTGNASAGTIAVNSAITSNYGGAMNPALTLSAASNIAVGAAITATGSDIVLQSAGGAISNTAVISGRNVSIDNTGGTINAVTGAIAKGSSTGTTGVAGISVGENITASGNLNMYGLSTNNIGISLGAAKALSGGNINAIGQTGSTYGVSLGAGASVSSTGTLGDSLVRGIGATVNSGGQGALAIGNATLRAAAGTTLTMEGQATTVAADVNVNTRGIRIDGTVDTYGDVTLTGTSGSNDGFLLQAGQINIREGALKINGTIAANGGGWRGGVNISRPIYLYNNTTLAIVGKAANQSATMAANQFEQGVTISGAIEAAAGQNTAGAISITGYSSSLENSVGAVINGNITTAGNVSIIGQNLGSSTGNSVNLNSVINSTAGNVTVQSIGGKINQVAAKTISARNITIDNTGAGLSSFIADTTAGLNLSVGTAMGGNISNTSGAVTAGSAVGTDGITLNANLTASGNINIQGTRASAGTGVNIVSTSTLTSTGVGASINAKSNYNVVHSGAITNQASGGVAATISMTSVLGSVSGGGSLASNGVIASGGGITIDTALEGTLSGVFSGTGSLSKSGEGKLILTGANSYTGATTINAGTLSLGTTATTGTASQQYYSSQFNIAAGATLDFNAPTGVTLDNRGTIFTGAGTITKTGGGTLKWNVINDNTFNLLAGSLIDVKEGTFVGSTTYHGKWTNNLSSLNVASGASFQGAEGDTRVDALTGAGSVSFGWTTFGSLTVGLNNTVAGAYNTTAGTATFSGALSGPAPLNKMGTGTQILTGTNNYSGATNISAGTLKVGNGGATGTLGSGAVTVNSPALLDINRTGDYSLSSVAAGSISGTGNVSLAGTGAITLDRSIALTGGTSALNATSNAGATNTSFIFGNNSTISANTLNFSGTGRAILNDSQSTTIGLAGGTANLNFTSSNYYGLYSVGNSATLNTLGTVNITGTYTGTNTIYGGIGLGGTLANTGGQLTLIADASNSSGRVGFENGVTSSYNGSLRVSGNVAITGTAGSTFNAGLRDISLNAINATGNSTLALTGNKYGVILGGAVTESATKVLNLNVTNSGSTGIVYDNAAAISITGALALSSVNNVYATGALSAAGGISVNAANTSAIASVISGTGSLTKTGAGTLVLTQNNTYTGGTNITTGTLNVGTGVSFTNGLNAAVTLGSAGNTGSVGSGAVVNNVALVINRNATAELTVSGAISGTGTLTQSGAGKTILAADNSYSGATSVSGGTLQVGNGGATGTLGTANSVALSNNATLSFNKNVNSTIDKSISGNGNVTANITGDLALTSTIALTGTNTINLTASGSITETAGTLSATNLYMTATGGSIGTTTQRIQSDVSALALSSSGDQFVTEANGATVSSRTSNNGNISIQTTNGTLTVGTANSVAGIVAHGSGNITLTGTSTSGIGIYVGSNVGTSTGDVSIIGSSSATTSFANPEAGVKSAATISGRDITMVATVTSTSGNVLGYYGAGGGFTASGRLNLSGSTSNASNGFYSFTGAFSSGTGMTISGTSASGQAVGLDKNITLTNGNTGGIAITGNANNSAQQAIGLRGVAINNSGGDVLLTGVNGVVYTDAGNVAWGSGVLTNTIINSGTGVVQITAGNGSATNSGLIDGSVLTITQNGNAGVVVSTSGTGNVTAPKIINAGTGDIVVAAGTSIAAGTATGGQILTVANNTLTQTNATPGKTYVYSGSANTTGVLSNLSTEFASLYYQGTSQALNTGFNQGFDANHANDMSVPGGGSASSTQVFFRSTTKPGFSMTLANASKAYGDTDPTLTATNGATLTNAYAGVGGNNTFAVASADVIAGMTGSRVAGENVGTYAYTLSASSFNTTLTAQPNLVIGQRDITLATITASNKTYNGFLDASVTSGTFGNLYNNETLAISGAGTFSSKDVADGKTVTVADTTTLTKTNGTGNWNNYNLTTTSKTTTANITKATLTATAKADARFVTQTDTLNFNGVNYSGFVGGDTSAVIGGALSISRTNALTDVAAATYTGVLVPTGLTATNYTIAYTNGNYTILPADRLLVNTTSQTVTYGTAPTFTTTAKYLDSHDNQIKVLTQTGANNNYTYNDGAGTTITLALKPYTGANVATSSTSGNTVVGTYDVKDTAYVQNGINFNGTPVFIGTVSVAQKSITPSASGASKVYDGTTSASNVVIGMTGKVTNDVVSISGNGAFSQKDVGTNLSYSVSGITLASADAGNYYLSGGPTSISANDGAITAKALTLVASSVANKVYDGNTAATVNNAGNLQGLIGTETLTLNGISGTFASAEIGSAKPVTVTATLADGTNGGLASNYTLASTTAFADITSATSSGGGGSLVYPPKPIMPSESVESANANNFSTASENNILVIPALRQSADSCNPDNLEDCLCEIQETRAIEGIQICYQPKKTANIVQGLGGKS